MPYSFDADQPMTIREQLAREIEQAPDALIEELFDFYLFIKQRRGSGNTEVAPPQPGLLTFLAEVQAIQAEVPSEEWKKLPHDGSINHDHYLYGAPKVES
ncbi:MAG: hypothetical protein ACPGVO_16415 [Spirulinaceae cyanobacterium]